MLGLNQLVTASVIKASPPSAMLRRCVFKSPNTIRRHYTRMMVWVREE